MVRVDNETVKMNFVPLDMRELISNAVLSFQLLYEEKGMGLCYAIAEGISVDGSEQHLYQVMDVLLDNALKYSTPGSMVSVDHSDDAAAAVVTLSTDEKMSVTISVDEADILSLELGQTYYYAYYDTLEISFTPDFGGGGNRRPTN